MAKQPTMTAKGKTRGRPRSTPLPRVVSVDQFMKALQRIEALEARIRALEWHALFPPSRNL